MYVRCPVCDKIHRHGFDGKYQTEHRRLSHFDSSKYHLDDYDIRFPTQYEIDKERVLFVAAGSDPTRYFSEKNGMVRVPLPRRSGVRKWKEATEKFYLGGEEIGEKIDRVIGEMVRGNVKYVRDHIESSSESDIFLHGIDAYDRDGKINDNESADLGGIKDEYIGGTGNTALHLAACEDHPEMIQLLLQKGAHPNVWNFEGRTPLAEAALWGRLANVRILLETGADKKSACFRSGQSLGAIDFAKPTDANDEERHSRSKGIYQEDTYQRKIDRRAIVRLLEDDAEKPDTQNYALSGFTFIKTPGQETQLTLLAHFDVPNEWKTIAVLYRGHRFDPIAAMSGWGHQADDRVNIQIAGCDWTSGTVRLCKIVGFDPELHHYDQDMPGYYYACHAEKQLIAYFISKHCFLPSELVTNAGPDGVPDEEIGTLLDRLHLEEVCDESSRTQVSPQEECHKERLSKLHRCAPSFGLKKATIMVSRPVCHDCQRFVNHINSFVDLEIDVIWNSLEGRKR
ncbi:hypothetical protein NUW58_g1901 [Xylaria curta]|uniref:Uncharacterized protein n=1 Tax=Xylaria curta TaxID=42375 RepID=A0ACC1PI30_9PEZI|nr:hypothetical protein NUW58_g1901 [Xylaria curta]